MVFLFTAFDVPPRGQYDISEVSPKMLWEWKYWGNRIQFSLAKTSFEVNWTYPGEPRNINSVQTTGCNPSHTPLSFWHSRSIILVCVALRVWKTSNICQFWMFFNIFVFWVLVTQFKAQQQCFTSSRALIDSFLPRISLTLKGFTQLAPVRPGIRNWAATFDTRAKTALNWWI